MLLDYWPAYTAVTPTPTPGTIGGAGTSTRTRQREHIPQIIVRRTGTLRLVLTLGGMTGTTPDPIYHDTEAQMLRDNDGGFP